MDNILLYGLVSLLYLACGAYFWQTRWNHRSTPTATPAIAGMHPWEHMLVLVPLLLHTVLLYRALFNDGTMHFGFGYALSVMLWLAAWFYWFESFFVPLDGVQALILPLAALCAPLPGFFPGFAGLANADMPAFRAHILIAMMAYSLFTIAAVQALLMALVEKRLHAGAGVELRPSAHLPPLLTLEKLLFRLIWTGFALLSATLVSGMLFSETLFGKPLTFDHKTLFGILSWCIFAALLAGRHFRGWRGRTALFWTLAGFVMLVLAYIGSRFVLEVVLHRI